MRTCKITKSVTQVSLKVYMGTGFGIKQKKQTSKQSIDRFYLIKQYLRNSNFSDVVEDLLSNHDGGDLDGQL